MTGKYGEKVSQSVGYKKADNLFGTKKDTLKKVMIGDTWEFYGA